MTGRQITWEEVDDPCLHCERLDMDDQVPDGCPFVEQVRNCKAGMDFPINPLWKCC